SAAGPLFKKLSLELGGKNPNIIFGDCDLEEALNGSIRSSFSNQGEICLCGSRILVEKSLYETFMEGFVKRVSQLRVGDPLEGSTDVGALISESHLSKVTGYIDLAKREGGVIVAGGNRVTVSGRCEGGY